jgi:large subunit ribosomal protein L24
MYVRKNDIVVVMTGDDKGKRGKVLRAMPKEKKVIVEGVNYIWRHVRRTQKTPAGGRVQKEAPVNGTNVLLFCPRCNKGVRVGRRTDAKGKKVRYCRNCNEAV